MKSLLLLAGLLGCFLSSWGQSPTDSLVRRLASTPADTSRVLLLDRLAHELQTADASQSLRYGQEGLHLARQLHYGVGEALMLNRIASTYFAAEDLANAARYYQQAVRKAQALPPAGRELTLALLGLGRVAVMQHDYPESQRYLRQVMRRIQQHEYPVGPSDLVRVQNSLGVMYFDWLSSGKAYPDSIKRLCLRYNTLALQTLKREAKPPAASLAVALNGVGNAQRVLARYDSASYYYQAALRLVERLGNPYDIAQTQVWLGAALVAQGRAAEAVPMLRTALARASQLHLPALRADCLVGLASALAATSQGGEAYGLARKGHALLDSLQRADQDADLSRLRVQFDTEQQRSRVRELTHRTQLQALQTRKQQQQLWWLASFLLAVAVGLAVSGSLAWRLRRQHTKLTVVRAEQDRLYALIAHDLRSPVMAFSGLADLLTTYVERQDTTRLLGLGGRVRQAADGLRELLDTLLNWALLQRGELRPVPEPVPVAALLTELARLYQPAADTGGVSLEIAAVDAGQVLADRQMTLTVLRNLLSNALQATPAGGRITVRTLPTGTRQLLLEVIDTGHGLSAEELDRIMSSSAQLTATGYRGRAGLGLRLSRLFAQVQGGQLTLRSALGQGTTATLALPCP
jgi:signal transduction histidine kinase